MLQRAHDHKNRFFMSVAVLFSTLQLTAVALADVTGFIETFNGDGMFQTVEFQLDGLDNPDWSFESSGFSQLESNSE